jgi:DNA-binding transcriptional ArsR family regulator
VRNVPIRRRSPAAAAGEPVEASGRLIGEALAERLADAMHALSTPSRVQILACLRGGPSSVGTITAALRMEQSAVSHQLRVLREHDLVRVERAGRMRLYRLADDHVVELLDAALQHVAGRDRGTAGQGTATG